MFIITINFKGKRQGEREKRREMRERETLPTTVSLPTVHKIARAGPGWKSVQVSLWMEGI